MSGVCQEREVLEDRGGKAVLGVTAVPAGEEKPDVVVRGWGLRAHKDRRVQSDLKATPVTTVKYVLLTEKAGRANALNFLRS